MNLKINITGARELIKALEEAGPRAKRSLSKALFTEGEKVMAISKRLTPVDTGALRASGHVESPTIKAGAVEVVLGFGGPAAPYAVYVHEILENHHEVGQAKFLEKPVNEAARGLAERLASEIRRDL